MTVRVQVLLEEDEREQLRRRAEDEGLSLSAWIRRAALTGLAEAAEGRRIRAVEELASFFAALDARPEEPGAGQEPDWERHREVIETSLASGRSPT